jgi:hypothetical protein
MMNHLRNIYNRPVVFLLFLLMATLPASGGTFRRQADEKKSPKLPNGIDIYPLELAEDTVVIPDKYPIAMSAEIKKDDYKNTPIAISSDSASLIRESYRVQLFTSKLYGPAMKEFNIAREIFDQKVWMDYEVPYYKIRIGDFAAREKAEAFLKVVKGAGYDVAWVVRVNVNVRSLEEHFRISRSVDDTTGVTEPKLEPDNGTDTNH